MSTAGSEDGMELDSAGPYIGSNCSQCMISCNKKQMVYIRQYMNGFWSNTNDVPPKAQTYTGNSESRSTRQSFNVSSLDDILWNKHTMSDSV